MKQSSWIIRHFSYNLDTVLDKEKFNTTDWFGMLMKLYNCFIEIVLMLVALPNMQSKHYQVHSIE